MQSFIRQTRSACKVCMKIQWRTGPVVNIVVNINVRNRSVVKNKRLRYGEATLHRATLNRATVKRRQLIGATINRSDR